MTLFGKIRIILALMMCCGALLSHAQGDTGQRDATDGDEVVLDRCLSVLHLSDSDFVSLRFRGLLRGKLEELQMHIDINAIPDTVIKARVLQKVLTDIEGVLNHSPHSAYAWLLKGNLIYKLDKTNGEQAMACYQKVAQYYGKPNFDAAYNTGCIRLENKEYPEAVAAFHKANEIRPYDFPCTFNLACAYEYMGQSDTAIMWYRSALDLDTADALVYYHIGVVYGKQKRELDSAIVYISTALKIDPTKEMYYEDLAVAYGMSERYDDAIAVSKKCLEKYPDYIPTLENLVVSYRKKGNKRTADKYEAIIKKRQEKGKEKEK